MCAVKAKIVLINPPFDNTRSQIVQIYPPLGILYLMAVLKKYRFDVEFIDFLTESNFRRVCRRLKETDADIYGISMLSANRYEAMIIAKMVKRYHPSSRIVLGGIHATVMYPHILRKYNFIDGIFLGESEYSLLHYIERPDKKSEIPGFAYFGNGKIYSSSPKFIRNLDEIPMPFFTKGMLARYKNTFSQRVLNTSFNFHDNINYHIITGRGCAFHCNFCAKMSVNVPVRMHTASRIIEEMKRSKSFLDSPNILFHDENFIVSSNRTVELCEKLRKENLKVKWNIRTRPENLDYNLLREMKSLGLERIFFGVESGSERILKKMNKAISIDKIKEAFYITRKAGVKRHCNIIIGYPDETYHDRQGTMRLLKEIRPDSISFSVPRIYPGTSLECEALQNKVIEKDYWMNSRYRSNIPVYYTEKIKFSYISIPLVGLKYRFALQPTFRHKLFFAIRGIVFFIIRAIIRFMLRCKKLLSYVLALFIIFTLYWRG